MISGIKGAGGVGIGHIKFSDISSLNDIPDTKCEDIESAIIEWHLVLEKVANDLRSEQALLTYGIDDHVRSIFDAYLMILSDSSLRNRVESEIRAGFSIPSALRRSIHYFADVFQAMDDPYLQTRSEDILHLGNKLLNSWQVDAPRETHCINRHPIILLGKYISVSEIARIPLKHLAGIVCTEGSTLSHTAVLANALGIPAVMGVSDIRE